jgi:nitric oxide dioxygenase
MLSERSRPVIEATLPAVGDNIQEIARRFYEHLFEAHPELLDGLFNRGNQAEGTQQQALAGSVAVFASALVNHPDRLPEHLLSRIAHKHASLGLRPDQYQVVHDHLFWAIADVLGDAVTAEVAAAWEEVYWLMAWALIHVERGLYSARGVRPETVWRSWQVVEKIPESADVVTFVVRRTDDRLVKTSLPGQYVTVNVPVADGTRQPRQYSLTRADDGQHRQFSVKRVSADGKPAGEVSTLLHDDIGTGDVLTLSLPFGDVVLDDSGRPVVFCSAGIGVAPMAGMLSHLVAAGSGLSITLLHADADEASFALRRQIAVDVESLPHAAVHVWFERGGAGELRYDSVQSGTMDLSSFDLPEDALFYLCGPLPFMRAVREQLLDRGVSPRDVQYEVFGPDLWQADADEGAGDAPEPGTAEAGTAEAGSSGGPPAEEPRDAGRQVWSRPQEAFRSGG